MRPLPLAAFLLSIPAGLCASCGDSSTVAAQAAAPAPRIETLRFSGIPDSDKEKLTRHYEVVTRYLESATGIPFEYVHAPDYTGAVAGLAANKLDLVWLGGVTTVQAEEQCPGGVELVATRDTDLCFKSYFIANKSLVESGELAARGDLSPQPLSDLAALKDLFRAHTFTFGAKSSTSGHVMPRHFLESPEVGVDPETGFKDQPGYQIQGGHSATLQAVATGSYDLGVLNYTNWEKADAALKETAPVVYVTPEYVDYCMVASKRLDGEVLSKLRAAFLALDRANPEHAAVLEAFSAQRFVAADPQAWDGIRAILKSGRERGIF